MSCCPHALRDLRVVYERRSALGRVISYRCAGCAHLITTIEPTTLGFHYSERRPK